VNNRNFYEQLIRKDIKNKSWPNVICYLRVCKKTTTKLQFEPTSKICREAKP